MAIDSILEPEGDGGQVDGNAEVGRIHSSLMGLAYWIQMLGVFRCTASDHLDPMISDG